MNKVKHEYTDDIVCPYCGYTFEDSWEFDCECDDMDCPDCGYKMSIVVTDNIESIGQCWHCFEEFKLGKG